MNEDKTMNIKIFQTIKEDDYDTYSKEYLMDINHDKIIIDSSLYKCVYDGNLNQNDPEKLFVLFNLSRPVGFTGNSMSPTDVIYIAENNKYYFCEEKGFSEVIFDETQIKDEKIKVVYLQPDEIAQVVTLDNTLSSLQNAVGGYIQTFYGIDYPCCIVCNDEAKINGMSLNRAIRQNGKIIDIIAQAFPTRKSYIGS